MYRNIVLTTALSTFFLAGTYFIVDNKWSHLSQRVVKVSPILYGHINNIRMMPTHFYVNKNLNTQIISDFANSRFISNTLDGKGSWTESNIPSLNRPHALTYSPEAERFFAVDTDNHQLISFSSFDVDQKHDLERFSEVNGTPIGRRPHDIAYNPLDKMIYVVLDRGILRFSADTNGILESSFISKEDINKSIRDKQPNASFSVGYVRALTFFKGVLYLSNSTQGNIIQIKDFLNPDTWTAIINKNQPNKYAEKGSFDKDGLILNDIEYHEGYWYATNYYAGNVSNYLGDASISKNKLIRWRTWEEFENSQWQDLSKLVHPESITYNFSKTKNHLFLSMFHNGNDKGQGSGVYSIDTSYF